MQHRAQVGKVPRSRSSLLDDVRGEFHIAAQRGVAHRLGQEFVGGEPAAAALVQFGHGGPAALAQPGGEELAEQAVEAIPRRAVVGFDPHDQQVVAFHVPQHIRRLRLADDGLGQFGVEAAED
ncbi:hypothetical protein D9M70_603920 [compost metagenome]